MASSARFIVLALALLSCSQAMRLRTGTEVQNRANPIRKVVGLLQGMQKKVEAEGKRDQELYDKYMCYCKNGAGSLEASIASAGNKIPQVESALKETTEKQAQAKTDLKTAQEGRREAEEALAKATEIRKKDAAAFAKEDAEAKTNIAAMGKAITALEKGAAGEFLQTKAASTLKQLIISQDMSETDRDTVVSFLGGAAGYESSGSGEITGILKQMQESMGAAMADAAKEETASIAGFEEMTAAKNKEVAALTKAVEDKLAQVGELGVDIVNMKEDLSDTEKGLIEDKKFLGDLDKNCATKEAEYEVVKKTRQEELTAIAETIKILNDDDALDLFKKALPGASSLLQITVSNKQMKQQALQALKGQKGDFRLDLISLTLRGKKVSFDKVITMIDEMAVLLKKEQGDDDDKKEYCEGALDKAEDKHKVLDTKVKDLETLMEDTKGKIETLTQEIADLSKGITDLDKAVSDATTTRKEENTENTDTIASNNAAKELLGFAKNRLNKFYNPKQYKEEFAQMNGAPPPPPEAVGAYKKKGEESQGVIQMIDMLIGDVDKEIAELETDEKNAQAEYEQFITDSKDKRAADSKSIEEKESAKAEGEATLEKSDMEHKGTLKEAMATAQVIGDLHGECDWILQNYDTRKTARAAEVDSLKDAKAVLSGADFSLVQTAHRHSRV